MSYPESPRKILPVEYRTHYEDLDIPLIMGNIKSKPIYGNLCDSMDISATFVNQLGIKLNSKYKGINICSSKKRFVISESCGRGNADIIRKNIFFTITTNKFKMMATLDNKSLNVRKLYDIKQDPYELNNLSNNKLYTKYISSLKKIIYENRREIFEKKKVRNPIYTIL